MTHPIPDRLTLDELMEITGNAVSDETRSNFIGDWPNGCPWDHHHLFRLSQHYLDIGDLQRIASAYLSTVPLMELEQHTTAWDGLHRYARALLNAPGMSEDPLADIEETVFVAGLRLDEWTARFLEREIPRERARRAATGGDSYDVPATDLDDVAAELAS